MVVAAAPVGEKLSSGVTAATSAIVSPLVARSSIDELPHKAAWMSCRCPLNQFRPTWAFCTSETAVPIFDDRRISVPSCVNS